MTAQQTASLSVRPARIQSMESQPTKETRQAMRNIHEKLSAASSLIRILRPSINPSDDCADGQEIIFDQIKKNLSVFDDLEHLCNVLGIENPYTDEEEQENGEAA